MNGLYLSIVPKFDANTNAQCEQALHFISNALKWLTGTTTMKNLNKIKWRVNDLIQSQESNHKTLVHILSVINITHYESQVNCQKTNEIIDQLTNTNEGLHSLMNFTSELAAKVQVNEISINVQTMLSNLRDCLDYTKQLTNLILEYALTAMTGRLTLHVFPTSELQSLLKDIEKQLPLNMHTPMPIEDLLHFYRYLQAHVLMNKIYSYC